MKIDLHCHTDASDGELSAKELVLRSENQQVDFLAITDHDTTAALSLAKQYATQTQIIHGVEISTQWNRFDIHIVGLNFNISDAPLQKALQQARNQRQQRAQSISDKLVKCGIDPVYDDALALAKGGTVTRAHIARVIVNRGLISSFPKVFDKYMRRGKPGYVPNEWMSIANAIQLIHNAGGCAVLAHPLSYDLSNKWIRRLIGDFSVAGGDGLEIGMPQMKKDHQQFLVEIANEHGLAASVGSDFHKPMPWRELGRYLPLPDNIVPIWQSFLPSETLQN